MFFDDVWKKKQCINDAYNDVNRPLLTPGYTGSDKNNNTVLNLPPSLLMVFLADGLLQK